MTVEAVLVDIVVRDKNGRPVTDLKPGEIEIYEDNVKQTVKSVEFVQQEMAFEESRKTEAKPSAGQPGAPAAAPPISSLAHINLVTFVFDNLSLEGRRLALQACEDFVKNELHENVLVSVFVIDRRLHVMQQFTNDATLVREAAKRAAGRTYTQYLQQSEGIRSELQKLTAASAGVEAAAGAIGRDNPGGGGAIGQAAVQAQLASMTLESLMRSEEMEREQQGQSSLHALLALIQGQKRLAGRKTVIYYSEGLVVPPAWVTLLRAVIGEANKSNLSFYGVDARGLTSTTLLDSSRSTLSNAAAVSRSQTFGRGGQPVTRSQVMAAEQGEASLRMNSQGTLDDLALSTGGFLISESNDLRLGVKRIGEDIRGYYELTYNPNQLVYDGKFRSITVKVARPDVTVQSRSGYFAIPASGEAGIPNVSNFELPLLGLLAAPTLPKDVDYRAQFLRFAGDATATQYVLVLEVPLSEVSFQEVKDPAGKTTYRMRFAVLALVKDSSGQVLEKFSQDYPVREIPAEQLAAMKRGHLLFIRQLSLESRSSHNRVGCQGGGNPEGRRQEDGAGSAPG